MQAAKLASSLFVKMRQKFTG